MPSHGVIFKINEAFVVIAIVIVLSEVLLFLIDFRGNRKIWL